MKTLILLANKKDTNTKEQKYTSSFKRRVIWLKSYEEFIKFITLEGLPEYVSFDHTEKTGNDAAKWLVNYCKRFNKELPIWSVHSANPVGKQNIINILNDYERNNFKG